MAHSIRIDVCGDLAVTVHGERREAGIRRQGRLLLAFLALHASRPVSRDELIVAIWGDEATGEHRGGLSSVLSRLRRILGPGMIRGATTGTLSLATDVGVDYHETAERLQEAQTALGAKQLEAAQRAARQVVELANRGMLPGESASWLEEWRRELAARGERARLCLGEAALARGGPALDEAETCARAVIRTDSRCEPAYALLMRVMRTRGNVAGALAAYEALRKELREELGIPPSEPLRLLHGELVGAADGGGSIQRPQPVHDSGPSPLSPALPRAHSALVGRARELATLQRAFESAQNEGRRVALLEGEPGIGKTRLAFEFADDCRRRDAVVLYGRCDAETPVPYQPFIEALRRWLADMPQSDTREWMAPHLNELTRVIPELRDTGAGTREPDQPQRDRLFDAVSALLVEASRRNPLLFVLDDLHWADRSTRIMLRWVLRCGGREPLLVLATYRPTEGGEGLLDALVDLQHDQVVDRILLGGLSRGDAAVLMRQQGGADVPADLAERLWRQSGGNPFFLEEMLRHRSALGEAATRAGRVSSVPAAVKDVIRQRLVRLSSELREVLEIASVAGTEFNLDVLQGLDRLSTETVERALDEAVHAQLIAERPEVHGGYVFEHNLTRQTLYEGMTQARRRRLHMKVATSLERIDAGDGGHFAEFAHHFYEALPPARPRTSAEAAQAVDLGLRALACSERAAGHASKLLAYEEAVRHYSRALSTLDRIAELRERAQEDREPRRRLLMALGGAQVKAGNSAEARRSFRHARDLARELGSPVDVALAVLGVAEISGGVLDEDLVVQLEDAIRSLGSHDPVLRARLLARLVIALSFGSDRYRLAILSEEAIVLARETEDPEALSAALTARHWALWDPANLAERLEVATELLALGVASGDGKLKLRGHRWRMMDLLELGDVDGADAEIEEFARLARRRRLPAELWYVDLFRGLRLLMSGRYHEAEPHIAAGLEVGRRVGDSNADQGFTIQLAGLRRDCGGLTGAEEAVRRNAACYPTIPGWRSLLALILVESGQETEARRRLVEAGTDRFAHIPKDGLWLGAITYWAEVAAALADAERAATLYELLAPFPNRNVVMGWASFCVGSSSRPLALLASVLGPRDEAARHFENALAMNERVGALPWAARVRSEYGRLLAAGSRVDDRRRGRELVARGRRDAERLGMDLSHPTMMSSPTPRRSVEATPS